MPDYAFIWNGAPTAFHAGTFAVSWYGLLNVAAFLFGLIYFVRDVRREDIDQSHEINPLKFFRRVFWGAYLGSRIWYCAFDAPTQFFDDPMSFFRVWEGGRASFGGFIGAAIAVLSVKNYRSRILWLADRVAIPTAFGFALVRFGNFLNSEVIGIATGTSWGVVFSSVDLVPRHPAQLYEVLVYLCTCALLTFKSDVLRKQDGRKFGMCLILAYGGRLVVETLKVHNSEIMLDPWLCVVAVLIGFGLFLKRKGIYDNSQVETREAVA